MPAPIAEFLALRPLLVLDGALATELQRRGANLLDPLWSAKCLIEQPDMIRAVHLDYFEAGADVATTATYQATFEGFRRRGIEREAAARLMLDAVELAVSARDEFWSRPSSRASRLRPLVAASVGSYGAMLADGSEYRGHYAVSDAELAEFHRPRLDVLARSAADLLAFETIPSLREARVLAELLREYPNLTAWIGFACKNNRQNCEGEDMANCAEALGGYGQIAALGVNCTAPQFVEDLLVRLSEHTDKPLIAYPNSGERYDALDKQWAGSVPRKPFANYAREWYGAGARLIGGCCRTTPQDIRAIGAEFKESGA